MMERGIVESWIYKHYNSITIMTNKFLHDSWIQYEINELRSIGLTYLIKYIELGLIYIVLYTCLDTNRTQRATFRTDNFVHYSQIGHEPNTSLEC